MKIEGTKELASTPFLSLKETSYVKKNGELGQWVWAQRPNKQNAVVIAAINYEEDFEPRLLLIREFRVPLQDYEWGLPAGLIDPNERPVDAVKRELLEETGLTVSQFCRAFPGQKEPLTPLLYNSAGLTDEGVYMAFVEVEGVPHTRHTEASEDIEARLMNRNQVQDLLNSDGKFGAKAYLVMSHFVRHGEL